MTIEKLFLLFIIYSFIGWSIEVICKKIESGKFVNRGFLIGPYCPIYGVGGVIITVFLTKYYNSPITLFVMAMFICAILEYLTSLILEKLFNARWWDYSRYKFNINGRVCMETMIPFGLLGCLIIYILNPFFINIMSSFDMKVIDVLFILFLTIFLLDMVVSLKILSSFKNVALQFKNKDNTEEITKKVKDVLIKRSPFTKRLIDAFPNVRTVINNIKNELRKTKDELRNVKKKLRKTERQLRKAERKRRK